MHGITERYLSGQKADAAGFVRKLLDDLESRISIQFGRINAPVEAEKLHYSYLVEISFLSTPHLYLLVLI